VNVNEVNIAVLPVLGSNQVCYCWRSSILVRRRWLRS